MEIRLNREEVEKILLAHIENKMGLRFSIAIDSLYSTSLVIFTELETKEGKGKDE